MNHFDTRSPEFSWSADRVDWPLSGPVGPGLAGAVANTTRISWIDPSRAGLFYRGVPIAEVVERYDFDEIAFLLIDGRRPEAAPEDCLAFRRRLGDSRSLPHNVVELVHDLPPTTHPTRLLRAGISALGCFELTADDDLSGTVQWEDLRIVGQMAELVRVVACHVGGQPYTACDFTTSLAESVTGSLRFAGATGAPDDHPTAARATRLLDLCWALYADHGLDAPTFTGMVVGSCLSDPYYNVVAGLSALRGPLLGGAGEEVLHQLLPLGDADDARAWVRTALDRGERIAGFGHRLYAGADPRVEILRDRASSLAGQAKGSRLFAVAQAVEEEASRRLGPKGVQVNVNFYAAPLLYMLGARPELVSCLYAVGRVIGIVARVREYLDHNRLFRPRSRYVGEAERSYVALDERPGHGGTKRGATRP